MKISYKKLIKILLEKSIIGIGENNHGSNETKWNDSFIIIENCKYQHILSKRKKLPQIISC